MTAKNPKVDDFLARTKEWQDEFKKLRKIMLDCGLDEHLKWGVPCYTFADKNVVLMHGFKYYCALLFFKGVLMKDPEHLMVQQTKNVQATRHIRFSNAREIVKLKAVLQAYVNDAIAVEKSGVKVPLKQTSDFAVAREFQERLQKDPALKTAFKALTPGRQRAYLLYFSEAKQASTRASRVEKCVPRILSGRGLDD